jgi:hypothetical protein
MTSTDDPHFANEMPANRLQTILLFLLALLNSPTGEGALDDADDDRARHQPFPRGGKWRGLLVRKLSEEGVIRRVRADDRLATVRSRRSPRKGGELGLWRLADPEAARRLADRIAAQLAANDNPTQPDLFD